MNQLTPSQSFEIEKFRRAIKNKEISQVELENFTLEAIEMILTLQNLLRDELLMKLNISL